MKYKIFIFFSIIILMGSHVGAAQLTFSWLPNSERTLAGYKIHYGTTSRNYSDVINIGKPHPVNGRIQASVDGLKEGTTYYFAATAYDKQGNESDYSAEISHTVKSPAISPEAKGTANFSWQPNSESNLAGYKIHYGTRSRHYSEILDIGNPDSIDGRIHGSVSGLTKGTTYYFAATAYDKQGNESDYSTEIVYTVPGKVTNSVLTANDVALSGDEASSISGSFSVENEGSQSIDYTGTTTPGHDAQPANNTTVNVESPDQNTAFRFEMNEIEVGSDWLAVHFDDAFTHPVVLARVSSINDPEPGVIRMRNLTAAGVEIRYQEWDSLDGVHVPETVTLMVMEQGAFRLDNGTAIEAACQPISGAASFTPITFQSPMAKKPVVITSVVTTNATAAVTTRVRKVSASGFELRMQEQEANTAKHDEEQVCYVAWEPSAGILGSMRYEAALTDNIITHLSARVEYGSTFAERPLALAAMQTFDGRDTARIRSDSGSITALHIYVSEEQSRDRETVHTTEQAGYMAFSPYDPDADSDKDGLSTREEEQTYHTHPGLADTDRDGLNDSDELAYWQEHDIAWNGDLDKDGLNNLLDYDSDGDGTSDHAEITAGFDPTDSDSRPGLPLMEGGMLEADSTWIHVDFDTTFSDPVVIARLVSTTDNEPCVIRIRNLTGTGFDLRIQEYDYLDGSHVKEQVHYLVMEQGHYCLTDGTQIEAGLLTTSATGLFALHSFNGPFKDSPVLITSVITTNEQDAVTTRLRGVNKKGFELAMQEQEKNSQQHGEETIAYLAMSIASGSVDNMRYEALRSKDTMTHAVSILPRQQKFVQLPLTFCAMQSSDGMNTARLRIVEMSTDAVSLMVQEEQSRDRETWHTTEQGGCIALETF